MSLVSTVRCGDVVDNINYGGSLALRWLQGRGAVFSIILKHLLQLPQRKYQEILVYFTYCPHTEH